MGQEAEPLAEPASYPAIGDYALIGDCRTAALVSREGSVDWLCLPDFDQPAVFAAVLDARRGGRLQLRPRARYRVSRRYLDDSNVLETTFHAEDGVLRVTDCMMVQATAEVEDRVEPERELLRRVEVLEGNPEVEIRYQPRPDYGRSRPRVRRRGGLGWFCEHGGGALLLHTDLELEASPDGAGAEGRLRLRPGQRYFLSLGYARGGPLVVSPLGDAAEARLQEVCRFWRDWAGRCSYRGPYRGAVIRSVLTLKMLDYILSGAVLAAPSCSLPEWIGGGRNWDYRYCWLRDAAFTLRAFMDLGYFAEGASFFGWLLHSTRQTWPRLQVLYTLTGEPRVKERLLDHLEGYRGSRPVRVGNGAYRQFQLDVYGEVILAAYEYVQRGGQLDYYEARLLRGLGGSVVRLWQQPDKGLWEVRGEPRHYTYSKVMSWVALDRLVRLHEEGHARMPVDRFRQARARIRGSVERQAWDARLQSYVGAYGSSTADASLLLIAHTGFHPAHSPRMRGTYDYLERQLQRRGLFYRYGPQFDGMPEPEGTFGICTFWAAGYLALRGDVEQARELFEAQLARANDVGLLAEETDPADGAQLGNFPQAFSHGGLIDAALKIDQAERKRRQA